MEALTPVRVRPLSGLKFTPQPLTPAVYGDDDFGVCKGASGFPRQLAQTVSLHRRLPRARLSYGTLRGEPAVSGFDSPFTPSPRSWERIARQNPYRPPSIWRLTSPCPGLDQPVSGLVTVTWGPIKTPSLAEWLRTSGFPAAPKMTFLASPRSQTPCPVFQDGRQNPDHLSSCMTLARLLFGQTHLFQAMPNCSRLVSGSFHLPCGILFSFLSRYYCAISLESCLGLGVDASHIPTQYPVRSTLERPNPFCLTSTGFSPSMTSRSNELRLRRKRASGTPKHHIPPKGFSLPFALFTRRYSGNRVLLSLPPLTKMFQFRGFSLLTEFRSLQRGPMRFSFGNPRFKGSLRLAGAYRSLPRPSSTLELSHSLDGVLPKTSTN